MEIVDDRSNSGATVEQLMNALPKDYPHSFMVVEHDEAGPFVYPVEDIITGVPAEDESWNREVIVYWNVTTLFVCAFLENILEGPIRPDNPNTV